MGRKVVALIPTKLCSRRCRQKNMRELNGKPMFVHAVEAIQDSGVPCDIIVATESTRVISAVEKHCIDVWPVKIPAEVAEEGEVTDAAVHVLRRIDVKYLSVMIVQPNLPFISSFDLAEAYNLHEQNNLCAVQAVERVENGMYMNNGAFLVVDVAWFLKWGNRFPEYMLFYLVKQANALEVDTEEDFKVAECLMKAC